MKKIVFFAITALCATCAFTDDQPSWIRPGLLPEFENKRFKTAARWIWHSPVVKDGETAFFRSTFDADSPVKDGKFSFYADDTGHLYLNGEKIKPAQFAEAVKPGRNVMAVRVRNVRSVAGLIIFADLKLESGTGLTIRSNALSFKARGGDTPPEGWEKPGFDDSGWMPAVELGDATALPFAGYRDYTVDFATAAERAQIAADERVDVESTWKGIESEPEQPVVRVVYDGNRPFIEVNGERFEPDFNFLSGLYEHVLTYVVKSYELGYRIFEIQVPDCIIEKAAGTYDFSAFDLQIRRMLRYAPEAKFLLSFRVEFPKWCAQNPESLIGYSDGEVGTGSSDERLGRPRRPSVASLEYKAEVTRFFDQLGTYVKAQPWGRRVIGVRPSWGIYTEWHCYGMYHGADVGPAMTAVFRRFHGGKYANENPPTMEERTEKAFLLDPVRKRKVLDFYACMAEQVADHLLFYAREVKRVLPGRLAGMYYGHVFAVLPPEGANVLLSKVLAAPEVDFLSVPTMYSPLARRAGGAYFQRTVPATFHRFGKLAMNEDDMRFHHNIEWCNRHRYCTRTPRESQMTMRRNYLNKLFDGGGLQIKDPYKGYGMRPFAYDDPSVLLGMHEAMAATKRAGIQPRDSRNELAVVISPVERLRRDGMPKASVRMWRLYCAQQWLYRTGVTFDILTLDDFLVTEKEYRQVVLLNVFGPSDAQRGALKTKLRRPGVTALWLIAPGSVTETGFSDEAMSDLTGLSLTGAGIDPAVKCLDESVQKFSSGGVKKTLADGSVAAFLPDAPKDETVWREAFLAIGARPLVKGFDYVRRHGDLVMFHTANAGEHTLVPPDDLAGKAATELFSGRVFSGSEFRFKTEDCDTLLLKFER
jgi:hypothetical protein